MKGQTRHLLSSAPVFYVRDLVKSVDFYVNVLGFTRPHLWGDPPGFAMPDRDGLIVMLSQQNEEKLITPKADVWDLYFWVSDVKSLSEEFSSKGVEFTQELIYKELYRNNEFIIRDLDGYTLAFGEEVIDAKDNTLECKFLELNPVIASQDVTRDVRWYEEKLGFMKTFDSGDNPLNYAGVTRQGLSIHLQFQFPKDMTSTDLRFSVSNIQSLFEECLNSGIVTQDTLKLDTPWGTNEFGFFDLSGNRIHFYEDCQSNPS